jgi:hypothetical protein
LIDITWILRTIILTISVLFTYTLASGQIGGRSSFEFLNIPVDTRLSALGGINVSLSDWDVNGFFTNPASLNDEMNGQLSFRHAFYYGGVHLNDLAHAHSIKNTGTWGFGVKHINYGTIDGYDPAGNPIGEIKSGEVALHTGNAQQVGDFRIGANFKLVFSNIAGYHATAVLFDIGGMYIHPVADFKVGMSIRNFGFVISDYESASNSSIPFDLQIGTSYKPKHMPVRFSVTAYNLNKGDLLYYDRYGNIQDDEPTTFEKVFSHFNFGAEILVSKNVHLRGGYNYLIRRQLRIEEKPGGAGFSFGLMIKVKQFEFSYSRAIYHVAGGINYAGLSVNMGSFYSKKEKIKE